MLDQNIATRANFPLSPNVKPPFPYGTEHPKA